MINKKACWIVVIASIMIIIASVVSVRMYKSVHMTKLPDGCNMFKKDVIKWTFTTEFSKTNQSNVRHAFMYWNHIIGQELFQEAQWDEINENNQYVTVQFDYNCIPLFYWSGSTIVKFYKDRPNIATIKLCKKTFEKENNFIQESIVRHEIGHVLGFDHSDFGNCLMFFSIDYYKYNDHVKDVCDEEKETVRRYYGIIK